jgi:hypothetical protein
VPEFIINVFFVDDVLSEKFSSLILHGTFHYSFLLVSFFYSFSSYCGLHFHGCLCFFSVAGMSCRTRFSQIISSSLRKFR